MSQTVRRELSRARLGRPLCLTRQAALPIVVLLSLLGPSAGAEAARAPAAYRAKVVVFLAEGLTLPDLLPGPSRGRNSVRLPFPQSLALELPGVGALAVKGQGAVGLMSPTVVGRVTPQSACLTLGAGRRASATPALSQAFDAQRKVHGTEAGEQFRRLTGRRVPAGSVVNLGAAGARQTSASGHTLAQVGALGDWLAAHGCHAGTYGNSDVGGKPRRHATALLMSRLGLVPNGTVERSLARVGPETEQAVAAEFVRLLNTCEVVAVDLGGPGVRSAKSVSVERQALGRRLAVLRMDAALTQLLGRINPWKTAVLLVSTVPADLEPTKLRLTPWILVRPRREAGLLTSGSTRRPGLLSNEDLAPTIIALLGGKVPAMMAGHPARLLATPSQSAWRALTRLDAQNAKQMGGYAAVIPAGVALGLGAVLLAAVVLLFRRRVAERLVGRARVLLLASISFPLAVLLLSPVAPDNRLLLAAGLVGGSLLIGAFSYVAGGRHLGSLCVAAALVAWALLTDAANSGALMCNSLLGQWAIYGRFYGIGNAEVGVVLAGVLLLVGGGLSLGLGWERNKALQALAAGCFATTVLVVGLPAYGANFGGALTCAVTLTFASLTVARPKLSFWRRLAFAGAALVGVALLVIATDVWRSPGDRTHLAGVWSTLQHSGVGSLWSTWIRKAHHNLWLMSLTPLSYVLLTGFALFGYFVYRPVGLLAEVWERFPALRAAFQSVPLAGAAAFVLNDSGLISVAMLSLLCGAAFAYVLLEAQEPPPVALGPAG